MTLIKTEELDIIKSSWRLILAFWLVVCTIFFALFQGGFLNLPAAAQNVLAIEKVVNSNQRSIRYIKKTVDKITVQEAVLQEKELGDRLRLQSLEVGQRQIQGDIKQILQLMIKR